MSVPRIELADPAGERIAEVLRERGFYVVERSIESLREGTDAALLLLAGDAEGALDALRAIRSADHTAHTAVILLGDPPGEQRSHEELLRLGADAHYHRPVSIERLVRKVETFLAPPDTRLRSQLSTRPGASPGSARRENTMQLAEHSVADWRPPERTLQLAEEEGSAMIEELRSVTPSSVPDLGAFTPPIVRRSSFPPPGRDTRTSSRPPAPSRPPTGTPPPLAQVASRDAADLSPRLRRLILDADRRVFPASPPLDLRFPAGDEPAHELVPDELLDTVSLPAEPVEEDPLEAFTYLGPVPEHAGTPLPGGSPDPNKQWLHASSEPGIALSAAQPAVRTGETFAPNRSRSTRPFANATVHGVRAPQETQDEIGLGERTGGGRGRAGELGEADALRLLWRVVDTGDDHWLTLELEDLPTLYLRVAGGELCDLQGPIALRVLAVLRGQGRVDEGAATEDEAVALLERRVAKGTLGRFELDRLCRRAREELLYDVVSSSGGRFHMRSGLAPAPSRLRLLGRSMPAVLVEGARRRLGATRVRRLLGSGALAVRLTPIAADRFARAELEPELVALLERADGATLDATLAAAPPEEGVAGAIFALVAASALRLEAAEEDVGLEGDPATAVRGLVEGGAARAEDAHYFDILGIGPAAGDRDIRAAYEERRQELHALRLSVHGLDELEPRRRLALEGLEEAWEILRDARLREAYRHALGL